jgi:hypothetical protein
MAGRAFISQKTVTSERANGFRLWAPVREGSDQTGVLAVTVPDVGPDTVKAFEDLALFAGYLITTHSRVSDLFALHRRRKAMTLAATTVVTGPRSKSRTSSWRPRSRSFLKEAKPSSRASWLS